MKIDPYSHPDHGWVWRDCEIRWIEEKLRQARNAALEEAEKACDNVPIRVGNNGIWGCEVKEAIRRLKV